MRIISGCKRGMLLETPEGLDTRPTSDRIKETLFNMIAPEIYDSYFSNERPYVMKIKICGLRTPGDANAVNEAMPDYIGFILTDGFKRSIDEVSAQLISKFIDSQIGRVGVFVDDDPKRIKRLVYNGLIDIIQLHGTVY